MHNLICSGERRLSRDVLDDFDHIINGFFRVPMVPRSEAAAQMPAMDINETEAAYLVKAELPGMRKQDLVVTINKGVLTINAEHNEKQEKKQDGRLIRQERRCGKFVRSLRLGTNVDEKNVMADYRDGVLSLTLPKAKEVQPRKVEVAIS